MPRKTDPDSTYGEKIIHLFARLLFSGDSLSLTELARLLHCSKQTVIRLVDDISRSFAVPIEEERRGNRKYYRIPRPRPGAPPAPLTGDELALLTMCRAFAEHLLGRDQFAAAAQALLKSRALLPDGQRVSDRHYAGIRPGSIDYTPHQDHLRALITAMDRRRVCRVAYRRLGGTRSKTLHIMPLKIFSHLDTVYVHARWTPGPGDKARPREFDPLLAIHRMTRVDMTDIPFDVPRDYDFETAFNRTFGIIKDEAFVVEAEFTGWAAAYVAERMWSPDQETLASEADRLVLRFRASSEIELLSWLLSFGPRARVLDPPWLAEKVQTAARETAALYG